MHRTDLNTVRSQNVQHHRTQGPTAMQHYHPVPGGMAVRQLDGYERDSIIRCRDTHDSMPGLDSIERCLVVCRWLPCADEGYGPLGSSSRTTGHQGETMPSR